MFDTSLYIYVCVKHFGMANITFLTALARFKNGTLTVNGWCPYKPVDKSLNTAETDKQYFTERGTSLLQSARTQFIRQGIVLRFKSCVQSVTGLRTSEKYGPCLNSRNG